MISDNVQLRFLQGGAPIFKGPRETRLSTCIFTLIWTKQQSQRTRSVHDAPPSLSSGGAGTPYLLTGRELPLVLLEHGAPNRHVQDVTHGTKCMNPPKGWGAATEAPTWQRRGSAPTGRGMCPGNTDIGNQYLATWWTSSSPCLHVLLSGGSQRKGSFDLTWWPCGWL